MIRNQKGFALVMLTMVGASVLIALVVSISKKTSTVIAERGSLRNKIISQRIYQDLAVLLRTAYENGKTNPTCTTGTLQTYDSTPFCFANGTDADCAANELVPSGHTCFFSGTALVNVAKVDQVPEKENGNEFFVDLSLLPNAQAQSILDYPPSLNAAQVAANTWGAPASVPTARFCGTGAGQLRCFRLRFCALRTTGTCDVSDKDVYIGFIGLRN